ncbi:MAG: DUF4236 domain-containing protein [Candidatus Dormibacteraceae bacterium]
MPLRFYRRASILPGVRLNLSRSGPSLSLGVRGVHMTVGNRRGTRYSMGIPGTGLAWYTTVHPHRHYFPAAPGTPAAGADTAPPRAWRWLLLPFHIAWFVLHAAVWLVLHLVELGLLVLAGALAAIVAVGIGTRRHRHP